MNINEFDEKIKILIKNGLFIKEALVTILNSTFINHTFTVTKTTDGLYSIIIDNNNIITTNPKIEKLNDFYTRIVLKIKMEDFI